VLTAALVACFVLAGASAAWTLAKQPGVRPGSGAPASR
jgi:hypothetical protein